MKNNWRFFSLVGQMCKINSFIRSFFAAISKACFIGAACLVWSLAVSAVPGSHTASAHRAAQAKGQQAAASLLAIKAWHTANGAMVYFVQAHDIPMLDIRILFRAGSAYDANAHGLAVLANNALLKSTTKTSTKQLMQQLDAIGSQQGALVGRQTAQIDMRSLSSSQALSGSVGIMSEELTHPAFQTAELKQIQRTMQATIAAYQQDPAELGLDALMTNLYSGQAYAHQPLGDAAQLVRITRAQVKKFYQQYYVARNASILLVGDISEQTAHSIAAELSSGLVAGKAATQLPMAKPVAAKRIQIPFQATQSNILFGQLAVSYKSPLLVPLQVANYILGGASLNSRLYEEVRQRRGLAYAIRSYLAPTSYGGLWAINFQTRNHNVSGAVELVRHKIDRYLHDGPTALEVRRAVRAMRGRQWVLLTSHRALMAALTNIAAYHLPVNYYAQRWRRLATITAPEVRAALHKVFVPGNWVEVRVGPSLPRPVLKLQAKPTSQSKHKP